MPLSNMDFNFAYFANFNFAHSEIEVSFGLIWVNYKKVDFTCQFPIWVFERCSFRVWALFLLILCIKEVLGESG